MPSDSPLARSIERSNFTEQSSASLSLNASSDGHVAVENVAASEATIKPNEDAMAETALSNDAERALEMIRITLATGPFDLKH